MRNKNTENLILNAKEKVIICNLERSSGKTYCIAKKIYQSKFNNIAIICKDPEQERKLMEDYINEINTLEFVQSPRNLFPKIENIQKVKNYLMLGMEKKILFFDEKSYEVMMRGLKFDYIFLDETKVDIDFLLSLNPNQIIVMKTNKNVRYINDVNDLSIEEQIKELLREFGCLDKNGKTTITRESILRQINELIRIKKLLEED